MADLTDVQNALGNAIENIVYPNGLSNPTIIGVEVQTITGYPLPEDLDARIEAGLPTISIFAAKGMDKDDTKFLRVPTVLSQDDPSITYSINLDIITIDGVEPLAGQVVMIIVNNKNTYIYVIQEGDTVIDIANEVGGLIPTAIIVDNTIQVPNAYQLEGRLSVKAISGKEIRRQIKDFNISIWSPNVSYREQLGAAIDVGLFTQQRIMFSDDTCGIIRYSHTFEDDYQQKHRIYRRDLCCNVEYPTVLTYETNTIIYPYAVVAGC